MAEGAFGVAPSSFPRVFPFGFGLGAGPFRLFPQNQQDEVQEPPPGASKTRPGRGRGGSEFIPADFEVGRALGEAILGLFLGDFGGQGRPSPTQQDPPPGPSAPPPAPQKIPNSGTPPRPSPTPKALEVMGGWGRGGWTLRDPPPKKIPNFWGFGGKKKLKIWVGGVPKIWGFLLLTWAPNFGVWYPKFRIKTPKIWVGGIPKI